MKKIISTLIIMTFIATTTFIGCQSPDEKVDTAHDELKNATENLDKAQDDASTAKLKEEQAAEWKLFKTDCEKKIAENEVATTALREKLKKSGKNLNEIHVKKISEFEEQNRKLREKISSYEKNQSDWTAFKDEFSHDMDALGKALKEFTMDNKSK